MDRIGRPRDGAMMQYAIAGQGVPIDSQCRSSAGED
jgi:hypothetical protein